MALVTVGSFVAGVAVGWVGRGLSSAPREEIVRSAETGFRVSAAVRRWVSGRVEWIEDVLAEGKARYAASQARAPAVPIAAPATKLAEGSFTS